MLLDLPHPVADAVERTPIRHVVHKENALGAPEVRGGDSPEALLPRRVPDLQLDALAIQLDVLDLEVDANRGNEGRRKRVVGVS